MRGRFLKYSLLVLISLILCACVTSLKDRAYFDQGKRYFEKGYYRHALNTLLPVACDGNAEAQYAVGYLYYYGYGVAQDTDVGYFWIRRSASQGYPLAIEAMRLIEKNNRTKSSYHEINI